MHTGTEFSHECHPALCYRGNSLCNPIHCEAVIVTTTPRLPTPAHRLCMFALKIPPSHEYLSCKNRHFRAPAQHISIFFCGLVPQVAPFAAFIYVRGAAGRFSKSKPKQSKPEKSMTRKQRLRSRREEAETQRGISRQSNIPTPPNSLPVPLSGSRSNFKPF